MTCSNHDGGNDFERGLLTAASQANGVPLIDKVRMMLEIEKENLIANLIRIYSIGAKFHRIDRFSFP